MSDGLGALVGVIPLVIVGGMAMKMTERMFPEPANRCPTPGRRIRSKGAGRGLARGRGRGPVGIPYRSGGRLVPRSGLGFGNFSNLWP